MAVRAGSAPRISIGWVLEQPAMRRLILRSFAAALGVFIGLPLLTLVLWSFAGQWFWPSLIPSEWSTKWWEVVFENPRVVDAMVRSFTIAPVVTILTAAISIPAGYAFARLNVPFRKVLLLLFLIPTPSRVSGSTSASRCSTTSSS